MIPNPPRPGRFLHACDVCRESCRAAVGLLEQALPVGMFRYGKAPETAFWPPGLIRRNPLCYRVFAGNGETTSRSQSRCATGLRYAPSYISQQLTAPHFCPKSPRSRWGNIAYSSLDRSARARPLLRSQPADPQALRDACSRRYSTTSERCRARPVWRRYDRRELRRRGRARARPRTGSGSGSPRCRY